MRLCGLGLPGRDGTRVYTVPDARDDSSDDELLQVIRRGHEEGSGGHDGASQHDRPAPAERVTDEDGDDRAEEASQVIRRHGYALVRAAFRPQDGRNPVFLRVNRGEVFGEGRKVQKTACYTLIVTEETIFTQQHILLVCGRYRWGRIAVFGKESTYRKSRLPRELIAMLRARPL